MMTAARTRIGLLAFTTALFLALIPTAPPASAATAQCWGQDATITGTPGNDTITGTPGSDVIVGLAGNDRIDGAGGNDLICGGPGHDRLIGGPGNDQLLGQAGKDTVDYRTSPAGVTVDLAAGTASGGHGADKLYSIEHAGGSVYKDTLNGNGGANRLAGRGGGDILRGYGGNDRLVGEHGWDKAFGGPGSDFCLGERQWSCSAGNSLLLPADEPQGFGSLQPIYPVDDPNSKVEAISFARLWKDGASLFVATDVNTGQELWSAGLGADTGYAQLFGGFDFDGDGWKDIGAVRSTETGKCNGTYPLLDTSLVFYRGRTGEMVEGTMPEPAICWVYGYPTESWGILGVIFGEHTNTIALSRYFQHPAGDPIVPAVPDDDEPYFAGFNGTSFDELGIFQFPSTPVYGDTYTASEPNPWGAPYDHQWNSHVANGLMVEVDGQDRLLYFTSGRVVQYEVGPLAADQLVVDHPYLTGDRTDIAGRTYGLVMIDPNYPQNLSLLSGATANSVYFDMRNGKEMEWDKWGNIERHLTVYDYVNDDLEDRFFSYAHNGGWGKERTLNRLTFPDNPYVTVAAGSPSRLAYNVFDGERWQLHVSQPGSVDDFKVIPNQFLWDITDLDEDGTEEWLISPAPGGYTTQWKTVIYQWNEGAGSLARKATYDDGIPYLVESFREPTQTSSMGYLYPVATAAGNGGMKLFLLDANDDLHEVDLNS